ncbi:hypothetical protein INT48_000313 [Thamnidium elegans]|uniref:Tyr recombinase domain-containing protein n=1 Tax=Thamnidium elegans TaxID=101142 RepID=A0A8H7VMX7_9FUNG|nr:hypothetical protein INT48_000313 [Thamnidium elegans]
MEVLRYTLTSFHLALKNSSLLVQNHERTPFIENIIPSLLALSKIVGFVEFKCETQFTSSKYLDLNKSDYSNSTMKHNDALGYFKMFNNMEIIIVEASSGKLQENTVHTIEDCLKLLESTFKKLKVFGLQTIKNQVTLSELYMNNDTSWNFIEKRTATLPSSWDDRILLIQYLELIATIFDDICDTHHLLKILMEENLGLSSNDDPTLRTIFENLRENQDLNEFITTILNQAPPIRLHKSTINLQPTFTFLKNIENGTTSLAKLQSKLAFLLAVTCFLRPSDLHRIPINSMKIENNNTELSFDVNCPKEKRGRRMIKRPACRATTLFVNSLRPNNPISVRTIQGWLTKLLHLSTSENRVSIRSIVSSLALQVGIPKEDIVTLGNWTSSTTFENHYRREHLSQFDSTNSLISYMDIDNSDDNEEFFDAEDMDSG